MAMPVYSQSSPELRADVMPPELDQTPRDHEEFLFMQRGLHLLTSFDASVELTEKSNPERDRYGNTQQRFRATFSDGRKLSISLYLADEPSSDVAVLGTPAWTTGLHGHNINTQIKLAERHHNSIMVGPLGEERDPWLREIARVIFNPLGVAKEISEISVPRQAYDMLKIHEALSEHFAINPSAIKSIGESRGGMTAAWVMAMAQIFGVTVEKALLIDPAMYAAVKSQSPAEILSCGWGEITGMARAIGHITLARTKHYPNTINPSPKSIIYELGHIPTMTRGDVALAGPHISPEQDALVLFFLQSFANHRQAWKDGTQHAPGIKYLEFNGGHLGGIIDERSLQLGLDYFDGLEVRQGPYKQVA